MRYHEFVPDPETVSARILASDPAAADASASRTGEGMSASPATAEVASHGPAADAPPQPVAEPPATLAGLVALRDAAFVEAAYRRILGRDPDPEGAAPLLAALRSGALDKIDVLGLLRDSDEGRQRAVPLAGLRKRYVVRRLGRLPLAGRLVRWLLTLLRLPMLVQDLQRHQAELEQAQIVMEAQSAAIQGFEQAGHELREARAQARVLSGRLEAMMRDVVPRLSRAEVSLTDVRRAADNLTVRLGAAEATFEARHQRLSDANARLMQQLRALNGAVAALQPAARSDREPAPVVPVAGVPAGFDTLYLDFEDRFRGSPEETRRTLEIYLDYVTQAGAGTPSTPILDIGCGRGEWLELLREHGCVARGVDMNRAMVMENVQRGLDVAEQDVVAHLAGLPDASLGMVTGFHIIEHLPFDLLVRVFDECRRVLTPGGCVIFETPNPENLVVGAYTFYFDPTHRNPLPPLLVEFLAQHRGFADVEIRRLHPRQEEGSDRVLLDRWFRTAADYAVIGWHGGRPAR